MARLFGHAAKRRADGVEDQGDRIARLQGDRLVRVPTSRRTSSSSKSTKCRSRSMKAQSSGRAPIELAEGVKPESLTIEVDLQRPGLLGRLHSRSSIKKSKRSSPALRRGTARRASTAPTRAGPKSCWHGHIEPAAIAPGGKAQARHDRRRPPRLAHLCLFARRSRRRRSVNKPTLIVVPLARLVDSRPCGQRRASLLPRTAASKLPYHDEAVTWTIELTAPADAPPGETILSRLSSASRPAKNGGGCLRRRRSVPRQPADRSGGAERQDSARVHRTEESDRRARRAQ